MADLWTDLRLALTIIAFLYLVKWGTDMMKNKVLGVIIAIIIAYLTIFNHFELLILAMVLFFGYPVFVGFADAVSGD